MVCSPSGSTTVFSEASPMNASASTVVKSAGRVSVTFKKLPDSEFRTWHTPSGTVKITYSEHSVLITGYDETYIYFNDPLTGEKNKKAPITDFEESWVQMGSQAITINS